MVEKTLSKKLLDVLCCPVCKSDLKYSEKKSELVCTKSSCKKIYKVEDGIPVLLA
ncbi:MAG: Trm112 family protein [Candidatus Diapherotrites archaeon]|nr:Trm112 family protein [Candidatus Diapherotrites archaeon]